MVSKRLNILNISDLHLGHNKTTTDYIVNNLYTFFIEYGKICKTLDLIIISGDVFDRLLPNNSSDYNIAIEWLSNLSKFCKTNGIKLRILEGTPSHDFRQLSSFNTVLTKLHLEVDFKYYDKISIEYIAEYDMNILYIPDEANETAFETHEEVLSLLKEHNLSKVDMIVMHGQFHYHLPMYTSPVSHIEDDYLQLTDGYILCGHIHNHSRYDRILTPGSFDRMTHNDESRKGGLYIQYSKDFKENIFLENKHAKVYTTLRYNNATLDVIIDDIGKALFPIDSNVRILVNATSNVRDSSDVLRDKFKHINIKIELLDKKVVHKVTHTNTVTEEIHITPANIITLMKKELTNYPLTIEQLNTCITEIENVL